MAFLQKLIEPHTVTMFVLALICLCGYGYSGYRERATSGGFLWILWLLGGIMSVVAWVVLLFG